MYLARVEAENYRIFGQKQDNKHLSLDLSPGLNLIVGENDSGKTCVIDAIRLVLGTATHEYFPLTPEDFHCSQRVRATDLSVCAEIRDLSEDEAAALLEYLEIEDNQGSVAYRLRITLSAHYDASAARHSRRSPVRWEVRAGPPDAGQRFEGPARELLRTTYLRPLRDAVAELTAKKGSRLAQILQSYPQLKGHEISDWDETVPEAIPKTLTGVARRSEHTIRNSEVVREAESRLNDTYLKKFSIGPKPLLGQIGMAGFELRQILERMELTLADHEPGATRGLGHHNVLFMATELLSLERDDDPCLPLVLIEEPESHLHPQLQLRLIEFFRDQVDAVTGKPSVQSILTSHSPNIASKIGLRRIVLMYEGKAFSLREGSTKLEADDYAFLERFLDVTKAELLFARGVLIVEGDAESILLPALADAIESPLTAAGVSIVRVGSVGLFRYSRILQRSDGAHVPIRVACVADRDIPPNAAKGLLRPGRLTEGDLSPEVIAARVAALMSEDDQTVRTFVSPQWTLEFDLALCGLAREVHTAVSLAKLSRTKRRALSKEEHDSCVVNAGSTYDEWVRKGLSNDALATNAYAPLAEGATSKAESAQYLADILRNLGSTVSDIRKRLPSYLVHAIEYVTRAHVAPAPPESTGTLEVANSTTA